MPILKTQALHDHETHFTTLTNYMVSSCFYYPRLLQHGKAQTQRLKENQSHHHHLPGKPQFRQPLRAIPRSEWIV